ncbi:MAG TPA: hypothetical protein VGK16_07320 [Candidatus Limnocylindrales bacterium]
MHVANYWDSVANLVRAGHVPLALIERSFGTNLKLWWQLLEPENSRFRVENEEPDALIDVEWLVGKVNATGPRVDRDYVTEHLEGWISSVQASLKEMEAMRTVLIASPAPAAVAVPRRRRQTT